MELGITDEDVITRVMLSDEKGYNAGRINYHADHGRLTPDVPAHSGVLLSSEGTGVDDIDGNKIRAVATGL